MNDFDFRSVCPNCEGAGATASFGPGEKTLDIKFVGKTAWYINECWACKGQGRLPYTERVELEKKRKS